MKVIVATKNKGKIREIQNILGRLGIEVVSQADAEINVEVEETGTTFAENALIKAHAVSMFCDDIVLADDSGLCIEALDGRPGVLSARYAGETATDADKMNKILCEMDSIRNRTAKFVCVIAVILPDGREITAEGEVCGVITEMPAGENGFGYDPIFYSNELKKTFAQASDEEKNSISHRGKALENLYQKLLQIL